ncbi:tape measure protein [Chengkuizengella sp. SCS-71B]|uniref:tape measure protein n=1 Tax=Chengkuizengella sp. SCS-71B TaxID=3115290 RepID=UPI0032C249FF
MPERGVNKLNVQSSLQLFDSISRPLQKITQALNITTSAMEELNNTSSQTNTVGRSFEAARQQIRSAEIDIRNAINQSTTSQNRFNRSVRAGKSEVNNLMNTIKGMAAAYLTFQGTRSAMNISDDYINSLARLDMINDGSQTTGELQDKIFVAANNSRGNYTDFATAAGKMGMLASESFRNNDELIGFTELMQKSFKVGGASTQEQQAGMYQLTQAMAAGKLQGDEFRSIMENAPMLAQAIADFSGKSKGELKDMSAEGTITADIIKGAMFHAADEINEKFTTMPKTFGTVWTQIKNKAIKSFSPVIQTVNNFINSDVGTSAINSVSSSMAVLAGVLGIVVDMVIAVSTFIKNKWSIIEPIVWGVVAVVGTYTAALVANNIVQGISTGIQTIQALAIAAKTRATIADIAATRGLTVAQWGLNVAMLANPIGLVVLSIVAIIAAIYGAIAIINKFAGTSISATGVIIGSFATMGAYIWNLLLAIFEHILGVINALVNPFIRIANFIGNVFTSPVSSIIYLFQSMADSVLATLQKIASAMDFVFGSNMADSVASWRSGLKNMADAAVQKYAPDENYKKIMNELNLNVNDLGLKRMNYNDAYSAGYNAIKNLKGKFSLPDIKDFSVDMDKLNIGRVDEVGKIKDTVDISSEDLKMMRDLAEMRNIQNFVTLTPVVQVQTGDITEKVDVEEVVREIERSMKEEIRASAEGVYGHE